MKNKIPLIFCFFLLLGSNFESKSQQLEWGAGLRIGEPAGLMIRKYLKDSENLVEMNFGTYGGLWGTTKKYGNGFYQNIGMTVNVLYKWHHKTLSNPNIQTYYGFGPQFSRRDYYKDKTNLSLEKIQKSFGAAFVGGIEFFPIETPNLSFFAEIGFYSEIAPRPFFVHPQGGIGARVNF